MANDPPETARTPSGDDFSGNGAAKNGKPFIFDSAFSEPTIPRDGESLDGFCSDEDDHEAQKYDCGLQTEIELLDRAFCESVTIGELNERLAEIIGRDLTTEELLTEYRSFDPIDIHPQLRAVLDALDSVREIEAQLDAPDEDECDDEVRNDLEGKPNGSREQTDAHNTITASEASERQQLTKEDQQELEHLMAAVGVWAANGRVTPENVRRLESMAPRERLEVLEKAQAMANEHNRKQLVLVEQYDAFLASLLLGGAARLGSVTFHRNAVFAQLASHYRASGINNVDDALTAFRDANPDVAGIAEPYLRAGWEHSEREPPTVPTTNEIQQSEHMFTPNSEASPSSDSAEYWPGVRESPPRTTPMPRTELAELLPTEWLALAPQPYTNDPLKAKTLLVSAALPFPNIDVEVSDNLGSATSGTPQTNPILRVTLDSIMRVKRHILWFGAYVVTLPCPHCGAELILPLRDAGKQRRCLHCREPFKFLTPAERDQIRRTSEEAERAAAVAEEEKKRAVAEAKCNARHAEAQMRSRLRREFWKKAQAFLTKRDPVFVVIRVIASGFLFWALFRHPIDYYTVLKISICTLCLYGAYLAVQWKQTPWAFPFGAVAMIFNPLVDLRISHETWAFIDTITAVFLLATIFIFKEKSDKRPGSFTHG